MLVTLRGQKVEYSFGHVIGTVAFFLLTSLYIGTKTIIFGVQNDIDLQ